MANNLEIFHKNYQKQKHIKVSADKLTPKNYSQYLPVKVAKRVTISLRIEEEPSV